MMTRKFTITVLLLCSTLLIGCGSLQNKKTDKFNPSFSDGKIAAPVDTIKHKLYLQFNKWQNVSYALGGLSKRGIDCSGFVHITFKSKLGVDLPRTTWLQAKLGREISKDELQAGDLVFFRTGKTTRHVGIYLEENKFMHASFSRGVMISKLDTIYWRSKYWKSVRILA